MGKKRKEILLEIIAEESRSGIVAKFLGLRVRDAQILLPSWGCGLSKPSESLFFFFFFMFEPGVTIPIVQSSDED